MTGTPISAAKDPVKMAEAMKLGINAGRLSYEAGRIPVKYTAQVAVPLLQMVQSVFDVHNATFYKNPKPSDGLDACAVYLTGMRPASYESLPAFIPHLEKRVSKSYPPLKYLFLALVL
jgi:hypothetical protein